jgi:hypothetical protein
MWLRDLVVTEKVGGHKLKALTFLVASKQMVLPGRTSLFQSTIIYIVELRENSVKCIKLYIGIF